jgi:hypothetical protein
MGLLVLVCGLAGAAGAWSEFGFEETPLEASAGGGKIREPFFDFLLGLVQADSLGEWSGAQVREHARQRRRTSKFPLHELVSLSRSRPDSVRARRYHGAEVHAVWRINLSAAQDRPMPYSILGYHPGSLRIARQLVLSELAATNLNLHFTADDRTQSQLLTAVRVFALEQGHVLLDADGWLDALLGAGLDDAWILGFVTGWQDDNLLGVGVSLGRKGRRIYGEFDFANDEVLAHGRPLIAALSRASRAWLNATDGNLPEPWAEP